MSNETHKSVRIALLKIACYIQNSTFSSSRAYYDHPVSIGVGGGGHTRPGYGVAQLPLPVLFGGNDHGGLGAPTTNVGNRAP